MFPEPKRRYDTERLDDPESCTDASELAGTLADIRLINRYLGGVSLSLAHLGELADRAASALDGGPLRILDVAAGSADIPVAMLDWAERRGLEIKVTALDISGVVLAQARRHAAGRPDISFVAADGLNLPFADNSFDIVHCSLALHHFTEARAKRMIAGMARVARHGIIVSDLRRSWVAYSLIYILTRFLTTNRMTRSDGPLSVLRAFTADELAALAHEAGLVGYRVRLHPFWRMALVWRTA